ncbi:hypothetical protein EXU48_08390 [Occultella glacieicola]|uniref:Glycoside hydrolase n=1 Tax=Occultella glacieicola TaxID=2518684 RepID=A0ABY2E939_9MICO|nr:glycosyl hydrolase [Occultella glacieicola]TDE94807.1 hypothetical protein EXU48_08390 [Occultella glacieicola]
MDVLLPSLLTDLTDPPEDARPMVRWWWFGGAVTESGIDDQLGSMARSGLGGVELAFVYPLEVGPQPGFGSPAFGRLIGYAARRARDLGLRFDLTLGSGWSFGGGHIPPAHAAQRLRWEERAVGPGAQQVSLPGRWPEDRLVAAYLADGVPEDNPHAYSPAAIDGDIVIVPAGTGPRSLLVATSGPTGQQVKRASGGAEGPVLDHYSRAATEHHLSALADPLLEAAGAEHVTAVFCDSLEVYQADWTPAIVEEFRARRGYDPLPLLFHLRGERSEGADFRADFHRTLSDLYEDHFLAPLHAWARGHGVLLRVQSYGAPPARVSSYRKVDLIEGEGWGWRGIPETKWAASAAHHLGVPVVSSETWTWVNSPSFRARPVDLKGEAHEHLLSGINQFIGHGWPYSPRDAVEPGWAFYAAGAISDRNAWWSAAPDLFVYLQRLCALLRRGEHVADVALWLPYQDTFAAFGVGRHLNLWRAATERIGAAVPAALREAGYDFDVIDEQTSADSILRRHRVIVVAGSATLPEADSQRLQELARRGIAVVVVDAEVLPEAIHVAMNDMNDTNDTNDTSGLIAAVGAVLAPDVVADDAEVAVLHRRHDDGELYLVVNTGPRRVVTAVTPRTAHACWQTWNAHDGSADAPRSGPIRAELGPYEAVVVVTSPHPCAAATPEPGPEAQAGSAPIPLPTWEFTGPDRAVRAVTLPHVWEEDGLDDAVGTGTYVTTVTLGEAVPTRLVLDASALLIPARTASRSQSYQALDPAPVGVVATVRVNGQVAGVLWDHPFEIGVGHLLRPGPNRIELDVSGTSVAGMRSPQWRAVYESAERAYGHRFTMQEIDRAFEPTRTGIFVVPALR